MPSINPLNLDPSQTNSIARRFYSEFKRRLQVSLWKKIEQLINIDNAFDLHGNPFIFNTQFGFLTDAQKIAKFREWIEEQIAAEILAMDFQGGNWSNKHVQQAYLKGVKRAFSIANKVNKILDPVFFAGQQQQFLTALNTRGRRANLELLFTRVLGEIRGLSDELISHLSRILADGIAAGYSSQQVSHNMFKEIVRISEKKAKAIARTELVRAQAEGQLDGFEQLGVSQVQGLVEFTTSGGSRVCPICRAKSGQVYTIQDARGVIPVHPNCACAWTPVGSSSTRRLSR